jgi:hypothetical protein
MNMAGPYLDASGYRSRPGQSGELSRRADDQHPHALPQLLKRIISSV